MGIFFDKDKKVDGQSSKRLAIERVYHPKESTVLRKVCKAATMPPEQMLKAQKLARKWIKKLRTDQQDLGGIDALMQQYDLSCDEGILLMCLAEAMLRIPDTHTLNALINDKLSSAAWINHLGQSGSSLVNTMTWGLVLSKRFLTSSDDGMASLQSSWKGLLQSSSKPILRKIIKEMMRWMSLHFIMGDTIETALKRSKKLRQQGYHFSYDMLGEGARSYKTAEKYLQSYEHAIKEIGKTAKGDNLWSRPGISIKLSALSPNFHYGKQEEVIPELVQKVTNLCLLAKDMRVSVTLDAEETERLDMMLDIYSQVIHNPIWGSWSGIGIAVQAYQTRALEVLDWLEEQAKKLHKRLPIRLVKGAYWDSEIKKAQMGGYKSYPVFTRKVATDASYIACIKKMFQAPQCFYSQCATHNAYSVAIILTLVDYYGLNTDQFELQLLHGMGGALHDMILARSKDEVRCRIYAPVGLHAELLPYLVRRLLENGANTSFVNQIAKKEATIDQLVQDPVVALEASDFASHPSIPLPSQLYGKDRLNSAGLDLTDNIENGKLLETMRPFLNHYYNLCNKGNRHKVIDIISPYDPNDAVGKWPVMMEKQLLLQVKAATKAKYSWATLSFSERGNILKKIAEGLEGAQGELVVLSAREAGRTIADALAGIREAIDFCYYYADNVEHSLETLKLTGPTGEKDELRYQARGIILCISPWNFPIAIFTGQVTAALVAGNAVIAKPASQTSIIASRIVDIMHMAGVPKDVLQLCLAPGSVVGKVLGHCPDINGFMLTGSTATAKSLAQSIATRPGALVPLIAETGGQNILMADSSALIEQLVDDVIVSAFGSAGQRCSALRILLVQEDIANEVIEELVGAMSILNISDPFKLSTDVGPVIDQKAKKMLVDHANFLNNHAHAKLIYQCDISKEALGDNYFAPCVYEIEHLNILTHEVFGPILHIKRFAAGEIPEIIKEINTLGFGLTFGIHSRINQTIDYIIEHINVGNIYVNRSIIGAVVGVQPFGGRGLSGTGPKAGGPNYVRALTLEQTISTNTAAVGGDAALVMLDDDLGLGEFDHKTSKPK